MKLLSDEYFMNEALKEAHKAFDDDEVPVGAVVVCENRIIARGYNQTERLNDVTAHAEMIATTAAANNLNSKYLNECTIYVTLEPCVMCAGAIAWAQYGKLIFAASDEQKGFTQMQGKVLHPKTKIDSGIMAEFASELLVKFFEEKRKRNTN